MIDKHQKIVYNTKYKSKGESVMNKSRRQQLSKWLADIEEIKNELETICSDEQEYFDNMPENLQGSQRGCDSEEAIEQMEEAVSSIEEAISIIEEIV